MQEYFDYCFSVKIENVMDLIKEAQRAGCNTMLYINGLYYEIKVGKEVTNSNDQN